MNTRAMGTNRTGVWVWVAAVIFFACGAPPPPRAYRPPPLSANEQAWEQAHQRELSGMVEEAVAGYERLCAKKWPRGCYDAARLRIHSGALEEGRSALINYLKNYPDDALNQPAAAHLAQSFVDEEEPARGAQVLSGLADQLDGHDSWDTVSYEAAGLYRAAGKIGLEEERLTAISSKGRWGSQLWDNATWRLVLIARQRGDRSMERQRLNRLVAARESSALIASYHSPHYDDALLRLGMMDFEDNALDEAASHFRKLAGWKTSRMRDDALLWLARTRARQGRLAKACATLEKLLVKMPQSSSAKAASAQMGGWGCLQ